MHHLLVAFLLALLLLAPASPSATASAATSTGLATVSPPTVAASSSLAADPSFGPALDAATDRAIADRRIVGAVVLVAEDGKLVYHRAAGLADREAGTPIREDHLFRLASMTKPVVAAATLALVEQGRLRLDDPITQYVPEFRPRLADGREPVITIRHLLSHTSGLNYPFNEPEGGPYHQAGVSNGFDQPGLSMQENLARIASAPLLYEPGRGWSYSLSQDVLGEVVARAAGEPLPQVVARTVTGPLGLADTGFTVQDLARLVAAYGDGTPQPTRMGEVYLLTSFGPTSIPYAPNRVLDSASYPSGGAGMVGTAGEYLRFLEALRAGGEPFLSPESVQAITASTTSEFGVDGPMPGWGFGFGLSVLEDPQAAGTPQSIGTWQWGGAYGSAWFVDPSRHLTVVVMTNTAVAGMTGAYPDAVRDAVYGAR